MEEKDGETNEYHMMDTAETGLHTRGDERGLLLTGEEQKHEEVIPDWATRPLLLRDHKVRHSVPGSCSAVRVDSGIGEALDVRLDVPTMLLDTGAK